VQIDFRHNAQHVTNFIRQIVHQLLVIADADGFAVIVLTDVNRSAVRVGEAANPLQIIVVPALFVFDVLLFGHWSNYEQKRSQGKYIRLSIVIYFTRWKA